jgi:defect-in-organelle-trafficking protein DotD
MKRIILFILAGMLAACSTPVKEPYNNPADAATIKLAEAAEAVSDSLSELARIQAVATPPVRDKLPQTTGFGLQNRVSLDWSGPIAPLLDQIAKANDYRLRVIGREPAIPVLVSVNAKDAILGDILRDLDYQAGERADLMVFPNDQVLELRYAS